MQSADAPLVVVVEDDNLTRILVSRLIEVKAACRTASCIFIEEALNLCRQQHVSLVVTDYHLPDGNGIDLAASIHESSPDTAIMMLTGTTDPRVETQASEVGILAYLNKPIQTDILIRTVCAALAGQP